MFPEPPSCPIALVIIMAHPGETLSPTETYSPSSPQGIEAFLGLISVREFETRC